MIREFKRIMNRADLIGGGGGAPPADTPPADTPPADTPPADGPQVNYPENFPKEYHDNPTIMKFLDKESGNFDLGKVLLSNIHAQKLVGADKILKPSDATTPEEWDKIYNQLGRPEKPEDYKLNIDGFNAEDPINKGFLEEAHKAGVLPKQAEALFSYYAKAQAEMAEGSDAEADKAYEAEVAKLKGDWGDNFDKEAKIAETAFKKVFSEEEQAAYQKAGLLTDPAVIKMLNTVGKKILDDKTLDGGGGETLDNVEQIKAQYRESYAVLMKGDKTNPSYVFHQKRLHKLNEVAASRKLNLHA